tara:strand:- start:142 stop:426 length:285 start_codon:yes stop_codon:yes gene_type:complete
MFIYKSNIMKKSQLKRIIREEIQKEIKTSPHQFGSDEEKEYQLAAAKLSNAVLYLDSDDPTTMNMAQVAYEELGPKLEAHLRERFGGDEPRSFR